MWLQKLLSNITSINSKTQPTDISVEQRPTGSTAAVLSSEERRVLAQQRRLHNDRENLKLITRRRELQSRLRTNIHNGESFQNTTQLELEHIPRDESHMCSGYPLPEWYEKVHSPECIANTHKNRNWKQLSLRRLRGEKKEIYLQLVNSQYDAQNPHGEHKGESKGDRVGIVWARDRLQQFLKDSAPLCVSQTDHEDHTQLQNETTPIIGGYNTRPVEVKLRTGSETVSE